MAIDCSLMLSSGKRLGYACYGCDNGIPAFYFHGLPGSRREGQLLHDACVAHGVRLVAPERPGYGLSEPVAGNRFAIWPSMIAELADHLGFDKFLLFACSGGAPYALACASELHARVMATGICCGLGEVARDDMRVGMRLNARLGFWLARQHPVWIRLIYGLPIHIAARWFSGFAIDVLGWLDGQPDRDVLAQPAIRQIFAENLQEAFHQGAEGGGGDMVAANVAWPFTLSPVRKLLLWHGTADRVVPVAHSERLVRCVPGAQLMLADGEGHFSLPVRYADQVVKTVVKHSS